MATVYRCDRCGKETQSKSGNIVTVSIPYAEHWRDDSCKTVDLCLNCLIVLHKTIEPLSTRKETNASSSNS